MMQGAIKMVDNPPDPQAVIPNEIIIISSKYILKAFTSISFQKLTLLSCLLNMDSSTPLCKVA